MERWVEAFELGSQADFVASQASVHADSIITPAPYEKPVT